MNNISSKSFSKQNLYKKKESHNFFKTTNLKDLIELKDISKNIKSRGKSLIEKMRSSKEFNKQNNISNKQSLSLHNKSISSRPVSPTLKKESIINSQIEGVGTSNSEDIFEDETNQIMRETISNLQDNNILLMMTKDSDKKLRISKIDRSKSDFSQNDIEKSKNQKLNNNSFSRSVSEK